MEFIKVFDMGLDGGFIDRYTFMPYLTSDKTQEACTYLGTCYSGASFSMWNELNADDLPEVIAAKVGDKTYLGECVAFDSLPDDLQKHVLNRIGE